LAFYDFNLTSNTRNSIYNTAAFYPLWEGIVPDELTNNTTAAFGFFAALNMVLNRYNGTFPVSFLESGLQWDTPKAWPPHQYIALQALAVIPSAAADGTRPSPPSGQSAFALVPAGQLALSEDTLPGHALIAGWNASLTGAAADISKLGSTVINGGNATDGETWRDALIRELAIRYMTSAFCSW